MEEVCERIKKMNGRDPDKIQIFSNWIRYYYESPDSLHVLYQVNKPPGCIMIWKNKKKYDCQLRWWPADEAAMYTFQKFLEISDIK